jgi:hypothetical protein
MSFFLQNNENSPQLKKLVHTRTFYYELIQVLNNPCHHWSDKNAWDIIKRLKIFEFLNLGKEFNLAI